MRQELWSRGAAPRFANAAQEMEVGPPKSVLQGSVLNHVKLLIPKVVGGERWRKRHR